MIKVLAATEKRQIFHFQPIILFLEILKRQKNRFLSVYIICNDRSQMRAF